MGKVVIPIASIPMGNSKCWYPVGRTLAAPTATGKIEISLTLRSLDETEVSLFYTLDFFLIYNLRKHIFNYC